MVAVVVSITRASFLLLRRTPHRPRERGDVAPFNAACSICGAGVVAEPTTLRRGDLVMFAPRTPEELAACCAEHGRPPFNLDTVRRRQLDAAGSDARTAAID